MIYYLGFRADSIGIIQGIALIVGMLSVIPASKILSKNKFVLATSIAVLLSFVGVGIVGLFGRPENVDPSTIWNWSLLIGLFFFRMRLYHVHAGDFRLDEAAFPRGVQGQFEGFRIVFFVLIPWIVSPFIANPIIKNNGQILDSNGFAAYLPTHVLFLISTLLVLATFVPLFFAARQRRAREAKEPVR